MANEISLNGLNVVSGGSTYKFTSIESIYSSLGINEERFLELLARDFYTVTLAASPTSSTVTYTDTDGSVNTFQIGQFARVADSSQEGGYKIWQCVNNNGTAASWVSGYDVMVDYVTSAISNKVDKVDGKGLSTEDFTTALKTKLEGLSNYDDTALSNSITSLQNQFNALVNADADAAIDTFNEIVAFLAGLENTETLEGILADISSQISGKMDKVTLAAVATSGSYNDLSNKPTIPSALSELAEDESHRTVSDAEMAVWSAKSDFSGSYNDLTDLPTIPEIPEEVVISAGVEPEDAEIWIDTEAESDRISIKDAPADGGQYVRQNASWQAVDLVTPADLDGKQDNIPVVSHGTGDTSLALTPNAFHVWGEVASLSLTLAAPEDETVYNEYMFEFVSGDTATTLSVPETVVWVSDLVVESGKTYQCSIVNNIGVILSV